MQLEHFKIEGKQTYSSLFDQDLPTSKDVMTAICCVATQYVLNPSIDLAKLALALASSLTAPEYAENEYTAEVAKKLIRQWNEIVEEFQEIETRVMPQHSSLQ